jgi:endonuclease YncB( thermonuclease family)
MEKSKEVCFVRLMPDGTNVNYTMVKDGWCWWYRKYAPGDTVLERLVKDAREAKKGLWADPQPVPLGVAEGYPINSTASLARLS